MSIMETKRQWRSRTKETIFFSVLLALIIMFTSVKPITFAASSGAYAEIVSFKGEVKIQRQGGQKEFAPYKSMKIYVGDTIITKEKSILILKFNNTEITLNEKTSIVVDELWKSVESSGTSISLNEGSLLNALGEKLNANSKNEVKTPDTIIGVLGTAYVVNYNPQALKPTEILVLHGEVKTQTPSRFDEVLTQAANTESAKKLLQTFDEDFIKAVVENLTEYKKTNDGELVDDLTDTIIGEIKDAIKENEKQQNIIAELARDHDYSGTDEKGSSDSSNPISNPNPNPNPDPNNNSNQNQPPAGDINNLMVKFKNPSSLSYYANSFKYSPQLGSNTIQLIVGTDGVNGLAGYDGTASVAITGNGLSDADLVQTNLVIQNGVADIVFNISSMPGFIDATATVTFSDTSRLATNYQNSFGIKKSVYEYGMAGLEYEIDLGTATLAQVSAPTGLAFNNPDLTDFLNSSWENGGTGPQVIGVTGVTAPGANNVSLISNWSIIDDLGLRYNTQDAYGSLMDNDEIIVKVRVENVNDASQSAIFNFKITKIS